MYYYARIDAVTKVCIQVVQDENFIGGDEYLILIDTYDTTMIGRKKYVDYQWVDTTPDEGALYDAHATKCHSRWLDELTGDTNDLDTTDKTSLVNAINECFQNASDGKTAISGAITAKASSVTIPTNPTFAQLAAAIGQIPTMQVATGNLNVYTAPGGAISGNTTFRPRIVFFKNNQSGATNSNYGIYIDCEYFNFVKGATDPQALSVNYNEWGYNNGGSANDVFTITDTGWSANTGGLATNLCWIAIG